MTEILQGGCKCGLVRYRGARADTPMFRCHCRDCQQLTGTGHSEMTPLLADSFSMSEGGKQYQMQGGSGLATYSWFCPNCGSPLARRSERRSEFVYVHAASFDEPSKYAPEKSIYSDAAQVWDRSIIE